MIPAGLHDKIVNQASDLPVMSVISSKVVKMVSSDNSSAKDLGALIARDQSLTAKVLKLANSALYSFSHDIPSIREAIVVLGLKTLKSLVVTVSFRQIYGEQQALNLEESLMWKHSIVVAITSREIAQKMMLSDPYEAFTAGLIHDIGKVVLSKYVGSIFSKIFQKVCNEGISFNEAERQILGFTHNRLGASVLKKWNFPDVLVHVVEEHNDLEKARNGDRLSLLVYCANRLALASGYGVGGSTEKDLFPDEMIADLKIAKADIEDIRNRVDRIMEEEDSFLKI